MTNASEINNAREAFRKHEWLAAYSQLSALDGDSPLEPMDGELYAEAAFLAGKDLESIELWMRTHRQYLESGSIPHAARCAFWVAYLLFGRREYTRGSAWANRARRLFETLQGDCVEQSYLLLLEAFDDLEMGNAADACSTLKRALEIALRFNDQSLQALTLHPLGRALIRMGNSEEGTRILDEAMVLVEAGDVSPIVIGDVYCSVISGCMEIFDLRRAQDWTAVLERWCESQPDMFAYNGQCQVHRAQILLINGAWSEAMQAAEKACQMCLQGPDQAALGSAFYYLAETHMLRGNFTKAEEAYLQASRRGKKPQPGMSLLKLYQSQAAAAKTAIDNAVEQAQEPRTRLKLLPAFVEIMIATGKMHAARAAADELADIAKGVSVPYVNALAAYAQGAVSLGEGDVHSANSLLSRAWAIFQELHTPYDAARARVLLGLAHREAGDQDAAEMEFDAALWAFDQLGAAPDVKRVKSLFRPARSSNVHGLTRRELQVLRLAASGKSNKAIAAELFISERTVDRHMSNIFLKLDVATRTQATSFAYRHGLI